MRMVVIFFVQLFVLYPLVANSAEKNGLWILQETFGVSPEKEGNGYPVITFVQRSFLLFNVDRNEPDSKVGPAYLAATTQDGVRVYLLKDVVSQSSFKKTRGSHEIIFNSKYGLCRHIGCNQSDDDQLVKIYAGDALKRKKTGQPDILELQGKFHDIQFEAYIGLKELNTLNTQGIVTFADLQQPKYLIQKESGILANTRCNKPIAPAVGHVTPAGAPVTKTDEDIFKAFGIADVGAGNLIRFKKVYGGPNTQYEFRIYKVKNNRTGKQSSLAVQIKYYCKVSGAAEKKLRITEVIVRPIGGGSDVVMTPMSTPQALTKYIKVPYLFSVNNERHHMDLLKHLSSGFGDRALAGYFIAEFNRSCPSKYRKTMDCQNYQISP